MTKHEPARRVDMLNGPLAPAILRFALPLIATSLLSLAYNAADVIVVGRFAGDTALAAVTSTSTLIYALVNLFAGIAAGTNVAAARNLGAGDTEKVRSTVQTSMTLSFLLGALLLIVGVGCTPALLVWTNTPEDVLPLSVYYLRVYFLAAPASVVYNFGAALLRAGGDTRRPMYFLTASGLLNVTLNLFFVVVLHLGVAGVAWATFISKTLSGSLILRAVLHESGPLRFEPRRLALERGALGEVLRVGLPVGVQNMLASVANVIMQSAINSLGKEVMAGSGACANIEGFIYAFFAGFGQTCLTFTSQNLGAGQLSRIDGARRWCLLFSVGLGAALSGIVYLLARPLLGVYISGEQAMAAGLLRMTVIVLPYCLLGFLEVLPAAQRGLGHSLPPMLISMTGTVLLRPLWFFTLFPIRPTALCAFLCQPVIWVVVITGQSIGTALVRRKVFARVRAELEEKAGR